MKQYLDILQNIMDNGCKKGDRTGTGTRSIFGTQMRFNLQEGFPIVTTKKTHFKSVVHELIWLISGDTNIKYLQDNKVKIWNEWADENGDLGPVYGKQWRSWTHIKYFSGNLKPSVHEGWGLENCHPNADVRIRKIDQLKNVIERIKTNPECRRLIVTAWNPAELEEMALAPCHCFFQFNCRPLDVAERETLCTIDQEPDHSECWGDDDHHEHMDKHNIPKYYLDCQLYQRSCDTFLGVPFNIASYSLLTHMIAQVTNTVAGDFIWTGGDTHIYDNHHEQVNKQLARTPHALPTIKLNPDITDIDDFKFEDFTLENYVFDPSIPAPVAI